MNASCSTHCRRTTCGELYKQRKVNCMEIASVGCVCDGCCWRTLRNEKAKPLSPELSLNASQNNRVRDILRPAGGTIFSDASDAQDTASTIDLTKCPPVLMATMLLSNVTRRVQMFAQHQKLVNLTRLPAFDATDHELILGIWRATGVRHNPPGTDSFLGFQRSYGGLACVLAHTNALRWQVANRVPFMLRMEDDLIIMPKTIRFQQQLSCLLTRYLKGGRMTQFSVEERRIRRYGVYDSIHYNLGTGGPNLGSEAYLTSLEGAENTLRFLCEKGVFSGADFIFNPRNTTLHVGKKTSKLIFVNSPRGAAAGGHIKTTGHFDASAWKKESAEWPLKRCMQHGRGGLPAGPVSPSGPVERR